MTNSFIFQTVTISAWKQFYKILRFVIIMDLGFNT